jgi:hypothetical protein
VTKRPYIIFTFRRTGGTSLMSFMSQVSAFGMAPHEPFNNERVWGHITRAFKETGDVAAMEAAVRAKLAGTPNIKHCFEIIPQEITRFLIEEAVRLDYRIYLLTRRDEPGRMASLFTAMATGAWGPEQAAEIYPKVISGEIEPDPVDPKQMRRRMTQDARHLGQVLAMLRHRNVAYQWLVFEELYKGETPVEDQARAIARDLGVEIAADDPRLKLFTRGGQGSGKVADRIRGITRGRDLCARQIVT